MSSSPAALPRSLPHPLTSFRPDVDDTAFLFDFDGTLIDIAPLPDDVVVPGALPSALNVLARLTGGAVGIISGRRIAGLERLLPGFDAPLAGVHGLEIRLGGKDSAILAEAGGGEGLLRLRQALGPWMLAHPGVAIEDKGMAIAIHYRNRPEHAAAVDAFAVSVVAEAADLKIQRGKMVVEIRATGPGKGEAVAAMMALPAFAMRRPLFFGDDVTDEEAFAAARAMGGGGVFVGELNRPTLASFQLDAPADVLRLISALSGQTGLDQRARG